MKPIIILPQHDRRRFRNDVCVAGGFSGGGAQAGRGDVACAAALDTAVSAVKRESFGGLEGRGKQGSGLRGGGERRGRGGAYATAVRTIALVAYGAFADDTAVSVRGFIRDDVAGAAAAVGDVGVGHCLLLWFFA